MNRLVALVIAGLVGCSSPGPTELASSAVSPSPLPSPAEPTGTASSSGIGGSQALRDEDWELLADMIGVAESPTIEVAVGPQAFTEAWLRQYPGLVVPTSDLSDPIFVMFNITVEDGCPAASIDAVVLDPGAGLVFGEFTREPGRSNCGDVAGDHTFVVAIRRGALPGGLLLFRLEREFSKCPDCGREREQVEVAL